MSWWQSQTVCMGLEACHLSQVISTNGCRCVWGLVCHTHTQAHTHLYWRSQTPKLKMAPTFQTSVCCCQKIFFPVPFFLVGDVSSSCCSWLSLQTGGHTLQISSPSARHDNAATCLQMTIYNRRVWFSRANRLSCTVHISIVYSSIVNLFVKITIVKLRSFFVME